MSNYPLSTKTLKVKIYLDAKDGSIRLVTEKNREYHFTDINEANWYFEGLGYFGIRMTELFIAVPRFGKTFHFKERHDPRGVGIDNYILECVTPLTEEEAKFLHEKWPITYMWKDNVDYVS